MSNTSLEAFAARRLKALHRRRLGRDLPQVDRKGGLHVVVDGECLLSFACNDYLGLAHDPATIEAGVRAMPARGTGAGAARLISGNHSLYAELESRLAAIKDTEAAIVFGSGYLANIGLIPVVAGATDLVLIDSLAHSCLLAGAALSRATVMQFAHNDARALGDLLGSHRADFRHCLIVTEGVFSMDGDLAPLRSMTELATAHDAWLYTDDAHGLGVVGHGRGSSFAHGTEPVDVPLLMGTLSKAVGAYGGYLCASQAVIELVRNRAASFVYSTGLPPATVAAAIAGLDVIANDAERVAIPLARARQFTASLGLPEAQSAIVPIVTGSVDRALEASQALRAAGFFVPAIRPPTVPFGTARLRFAFSAAHTSEQVEELAAAVRRLDLGPGNE